MREQDTYFLIENALDDETVIAVERGSRDETSFRCSTCHSRQPLFVIIKNMEVDPNGHAPV